MVRPFQVANYSNAKVAIANTSLSQNNMYTVKPNENKPFVWFWMGSANDRQPVMLVSVTERWQTGSENTRTVCPMIYPCPATKLS